MFILYSSVNWQSGNQWATGQATASSEIRDCACTSREVLNHTLKGSDGPRVQLNNSSKGYVGPHSPHTTKLRAYVDHYGVHWGVPFLARQALPLGTYDSICLRSLNVCTDSGYSAASLLLNCLADCETRRDDVGWTSSNFIKIHKCPAYTFKLLEVE